MVVKVTGGSSRCLALVQLQRPEWTAGEAPGLLPGQGGTPTAGFCEWESLWGKSW